MSETGNLDGRQVLVVEDEYFLAGDLAKALESEGARVIGPVGTVDDALELIDGTEHLDGAVVDINLRGEMAFPVADALMERSIPYVFATGYDSASIPPRYEAAARCEKPVDAAKLVRVLFG